ncbi:MAG: PAS domain-containing sensor histidine kinase [Oscillospiraceae bacterium]|nr:PAS domain-containing sensor histidine kinase [Oscillospiraceae bacterium]
MQDIRFDKLSQAFEHSPIPFALLDSEMHIVYMNTALSSRYPDIKDPVRLYLLFEDVDKATILNYLKADKAYELMHDLPDQKGARITLTALFSESDPQRLIGATAVIPSDSSLSSNPFSAAEDNECQLMVNRELRERINVMFTSIYALSQLSDLDKSNRVCEYINSINQNCYQLLRVSDNLAKFMRLSAQNDHANFALVDFSAYIKKLISTVIHLDNKNLIPIHFSCPDEIVPVMLDQDRMEFAIVNILLNSIKYTRDGNEIDISLKCVGKDAVVTICDKGAGIPKNILPLVGSPYFAYSHKDKFDAGFGIGLYIAKKYIASHAGLFSIQSVEGEGTTVTFSIPIDSDDTSRPDTTVYLSSPPQFQPERKFSQTLIQLSEVCYYPAL